MKISSMEKTILARIKRISEKGPEASPEETAQLVDWLRHPSVAVRTAVAEYAASAFDGPDYDLSQALLMCARSDPSLEVRIACLDTLGNAGIQLQEYADLEAEDEGRDADYEIDTSDQYLEIRQLCNDIALDETEPETVRESALLQLGRLGDDPAAREAVRSFLNHPAPALRAAAVQAVGYWWEPHGAEEILLARLDDPEENVQRAALIACGNLQIAGAIDRLRTLCSSTNANLRGGALIGFANAGPIEEVESLLDSVRKNLSSDDPLYGDALDAAHDLAFRRANEVPDDDIDEAIMDDEEDEDWSEEPEDEAEATIEGRVEAFIQHEGGDALSDSDKWDLALTARGFQDFLRECMGTPLSQVSAIDVREYLMEFYPRKVTMLPEEADPVPNRLARFLHFLGEQGIAQHGEDLADYTLSLSERFSKDIRDPANWTMAKSIMMVALAEGVDLSDQKAMDEFLVRYNARSLAKSLLDQQGPKSISQTPTTPKVGRNDPCPCGSGKKFKNCCG